jgi:farnesyl diphosphate synthase
MPMNNHVLSPSAFSGDSFIFPSTESPSKRNKLLNIFPRIRQELLSYLASCDLSKEDLNWFERSINNNVPHGKLNRSLSVIDTLEILKERPLTEEEYLQAATMGWCIELVRGKLT